METTTIEQDIEYYGSVHLFNLMGELKGESITVLRGMAGYLLIPTRYDDGTRKPKDVLAAAIYEHFRQARTNAV